MPAYRVLDGSLLFEFETTATSRLSARHVALNKAKVRGEAASNCDTQRPPGRQHLVAPPPAGVDQWGPRPRAINTANRQTARQTQRLIGTTWVDLDFGSVLARHCLID